MKKILIVLSGVMLSVTGAAQSKKYDSMAIMIIDRMTDVIGDLESCSFRLNTAIDINDRVYGLIKQFTEFEVYMSGQNKMLVNANGQKGHRQLWYNGAQLAYYSFNENSYSLLQAPNTTVKMIDSINNIFDIDFPAADFFYPAFTDDLLEHSDSVRFAGLTEIGGKEYFHIIVFGKEKNLQLWINNDACTLPARFAITYKQSKGVPQYMALFSEWQINPKLPNTMFDFLPPPGAARVRLLSKNDK